MGIDKANDILDTHLSGDLIEKMMTHVIMEDADPESEVDQTVRNLKDEIQQMRTQCAVYGISDEPDLSAAEALRSHPLPHWIERMTISYLYTKGCWVEKDLLGWNFTWPDGEIVRSAVFRSRDLLTDGNLLSLENPRIRGLAMNLPQVIQEQPLLCVSVVGLPESVSGFWGLFEIRISSQRPAKSQMRVPQVRRDFLAVFLSEEGKLFLPTARHIWDAFQTAEPQVIDTLGDKESAVAYTRLLEVAEQAGQELYDALQQEHIVSVAREEERGMVAFASRRKAINRVGLPEVRQYRLSRCDSEEAEWRNELESARQIIPEIRALLLLRILGRD
jgi:hypothetical protein